MFGTWPSWQTHTFPNPSRENTELQRLRRLLKFFGVLLFIGLASAFAIGMYTGVIPYLFDIVLGHIEITSDEKTIAEVIESNELTKKQTDKLRLVLEVRQFASEALGLPNNKSYTIYSDIGRRYVGWNVYAAPRYSVEPHTWCFPFAGCIVYRGFFVREKADRFAHDIARSDGLDTYVGPIAGYSTLGFFDDPILSSNLYLEDFRLVSLIIHELAHQKLYFPGQSSVNEAFAVVVEREGLLRWLESSGRQAWLPTVRAAWDAEDRKVGDILEARAKLETLYESDVSVEEKEAGKRLILEELRGALCGSTCGDKGLPKAGGEEFELNNAYMVAVYTYYGRYSELDSLLHSLDGDLKQFYARVGETYR